VGSESERSLRSGELAKLAGVSSDTLRLYERKGLLPEPGRTPSGHRRYSPEALDRVRLVRAALGIGFTLDELSAILQERERGGAPCHQVRELAAEKLASLERRLGALVELRDRLKAVLKDWDRALARRPSSAPARLLEDLSDAVRPGGRDLLPHLVPSLTRPFPKEADDD